MKIGCMACRFCEQQDDSEGICRRYPPAAGEEPPGIYPQVHAIDWCGEFQPAGLHGMNDGFTEWDHTRLKIGDADGRG